MQLPQGLGALAHFVGLVVRQVFGQRLDGDRVRHAEAWGGLVRHLGPLGPLLRAESRARLRAQKVKGAGAGVATTPLCCVRRSIGIGSPCRCDWTRMACSSVRQHGRLRSLIDNISTRRGGLSRNEDRREDRAHSDAAADLGVCGRITAPLTLYYVVRLRLLKRPRHKASTISIPSSSETIQAD